MKYPLLLFICWISALSSAQTIETESADVPFATIDQVPIYPGCTGENNETLKKCTAGKIQEYVSANFNIKLAESLNLTPGRKRMAVQFKIDKEGKVVEVKARAPHPKLEEEAIRVVLSIPQMEAGIQRGKKVNVLYALPIMFEIAPPKRERKMKKTKS